MLALRRAVDVSNDEAWRLEAMSQELTKTSSIEIRIDSDTFADLSKKLEDDRKAAEGTKRMLLVLIFNLSAATGGAAGATSQDHSG